MKNKKDISWYNDKIQDIRKRKRVLSELDIEPSMRRKIKDDLKREQRGYKRSEKNELKKFIKDEINRFKK